MSMWAQSSFSRKISRSIALLGVRALNALAQQVPSPAFLTLLLKQKPHYRRKLSEMYR